MHFFSKYSVKRFFTSGFTIYMFPKKYSGLANFEYLGLQVRYVSPVTNANITAGVSTHFLHCFSYSPLMSFSFKQCVNLSKCPLICERSLSLEFTHLIGVEWV